MQRNLRKICNAAGYGVACKTRSLCTEYFHGPGEPELGLDWDRGGIISLMPVDTCWIGGIEEPNRRSCLDSIFIYSFISLPRWFCTFFDFSTVIVPLKLHWITVSLPTENILGRHRKEKEKLHKNQIETIIHFDKSI